MLRAHGLRGELHVQLFRPRREKADAREKKSVYLDDKAYALKSVRWISPVAVVLRLDGLPDRTAAEALENAIVTIDPKDPPLALADDADRYIGAPAIDARTGRELGEVEAVVDNGAQPVLQLLYQGREVLVPCVPAFVGGLDEHQRLLLYVMPGLFEDDDEAQ